MKISQYFKEKNFRIGVILYLIITFIAYLTTGMTGLIAGFILGYDFQFFIGLLFGVIYALRNLNPEQGYLKCGILVAIIGGVVSAFIIALWTTLVYIWRIIDFFVFFGYLLITAVLIGLLIGGIISSYFMYIELKGDKDKEEDHINDDFYKDLIEDKK